MTRTIRIVFAVAVVATIVWFWAATSVLGQGALAPQQRSTPVLIAVDEPKESLKVTFDIGAYSACTVFAMIDPDPSNPEGYTPRKCWMDITELVGYTDNWKPIPPYDNDWDVYVEVYYRGDDLVAQRLIESNHLRIHR